MRAQLLVAFAAALSGCVVPGPNLSFEIDCPVPAGRDLFPATGEVECRAWGPFTRAGDVDWDFGDGSAAEGDRVAHTYAGPGSYPLRATLGPSVRTASVGIPAVLTLEGEAPLGGAAGFPTGEYASVPFDVLPGALVPDIVIDAPAGATRLGILLVADNGTATGGCSCTTPASYPLTVPLEPGRYELRVWGEVGPGFAPASTIAFEARILIPYKSTFLGPFRLD